MWILSLILLDRPKLLRQQVGSLRIFIFFSLSVILLSHPCPPVLPMPSLALTFPGEIYWRPWMPHHMPALIPPFLLFLFVFSPFFGLIFTSFIIDHHPPPSLTPSPLPRIPSCLLLSSLSVQRDLQQSPKLIRSRQSFSQCEGIGEGDHFRGVFKHLDSRRKRNPVTRWRSIWEKKPAEGFMKKKKPEMSKNIEDMGLWIELTSLYSYTMENTG